MSNNLQIYRFKSFKSLIVMEHFIIREQDTKIGFSLGWVFLWLGFSCRFTSGKTHWVFWVCPLFVDVLA